MGGGSCRSVYRRVSVRCNELQNEEQGEADSVAAAARRAEAEGAQVVELTREEISGSAVLQTSPPS